MFTVASLMHGRPSVNLQSFFSQIFPSITVISPCHAYTKITESNVHSSTEGVCIRDGVLIVLPYASLGARMSE